MRKTRITVEESGGYKVTFTESRFYTHFEKTYDTIQEAAFYATQWENGSFNISELRDEWN